jgi:hypothetical protein
MNENILRYRSGQPISPNVLKALLLTGKVGFLTRDLWDTFFATGSKRWRMRQIANLVDHGFLRMHTNPEATFNRH